MGLKLVILAGFPSLGSRTTLAVFSLLGKISLSKEILNKCISSIFSSPKQLLIALKLYLPYPGLLFIFIEKMSLWSRLF